MSSDSKSSTLISESETKKSILQHTSEMLSSYINKIKIAYSTSDSSGHPNNVGGRWTRRH